MCKLENTNQMYDVGKLSMHCVNANKYKILKKDHVILYIYIYIYIYIYERDGPCICKRD